MLLARVAAALKWRRFALAASLNQDRAMDALAQVPCSPVFVVRVQLFPSNLAFRSEVLSLSLPANGM